VAARARSVRTASPEALLSSHAKWHHDLMEARPSVGAELLLVATDPNRGGLLARHRRRFRKALAVAQGMSARAPLAGWRARRRAYAELERAGLMAPDSTALRPRLAHREARTAALRRVRRCLRDEDAGDPRDRELLLLMGWSGLLTAWLSRDERRVAVRRLQHWQSSTSAGFGAIGLAAAANLAIEAAAGDFSGGDSGGFDVGGGGDGGGGGQ
jgi:uncharacterized membrane protein YgcG